MPTSVLYLGKQSILKLILQTPFWMHFTQFGLSASIILFSIDQSDLATSTKSLSINVYFMLCNSHPLYITFIHTLKQTFRFSEENVSGACPCKTYILQYIYIYARCFCQKGLHFIQIIQFISSCIHARRKSPNLDKLRHHSCVQCKMCGKGYI